MFFRSESELGFVFAWLSHEPARLLSLDCETLGAKSCGEKIRNLGEKFSLVDDIIRSFNYHATSARRPASKQTRSKEKRRTTQIFADATTTTINALGWNCRDGDGGCSCSREENLVQVHEPEAKYKLS